MRKEGAPPPSTLNPVGKLFLCFETKTFLTVLFSLTLVAVVWNLQPYYETVFLSSTATATATTTPPCSSSVPAATESLPVRSADVNPLAEEKLVRSASASSPPPAIDPSTPPPAVDPSTPPPAVDPSTPPPAVEPSTPPPAVVPSTPPPAGDPNRRTFQAYGSAAALFVQMGAYRGGPRTFAVVGLASKPTHVFGRPWYKCEWVPADGGPSVRTKAFKILPDWGYGRVYTVVVVNCTFPENPNANNSGGRLMLNAYYGESPRRFERFVALEEAPGSYDESKYRPPRQYEYLYCGSSLYGDLNPARIREWVAYHAWFFGPSSHFVFHDAGGVSAAVRDVLEPWVRAGRVTVQDIRAQSEYDGYYYNQFLVVNDCLHRYRHVANWTFYFDVDEYLYLPDGNTLQSVLSEFSKYTQFTIQQNAMSSLLCLNHSSSSHNYSREWGFEKLMFKDSRTRVRRDRKYAIQASNAYATGVHMSENVVGGTFHKTETKIRYYHYHNSITVPGELCRQLLPPAAKNATTWLDKVPYIYDDTMNRLAPLVKKFEYQTIGVGSQ